MIFDLARPHHGAALDRRRVIDVATVRGPDALNGSFVPAENRGRAMTRVIAQAIEWARPSEVLEIGCKHGVSTALLALLQRRVMGGHSVTTYDVEKTPHAGPIWGCLGLRAGITHRIRSKEDPVRGGPYGFVLIDALHTAAGMAHDWREVEPLLAERAVVVFDDATYPGCDDWPVRNVPGFVNHGTFGYVVRGA